MRAMMFRNLRRLYRCTTATAAIEAAIFAPIFMALTLGVTDIGSGVFVRMTVNAATQSGASYAVSKSSGVCTSMTAACLNGIKTAMNDVASDSSFCTKAACAATFTSCADPKGGMCFTVTANYPFTPILAVTSGFYSHSWTNNQTLSWTTTVRVQ
jgi:hypothetical protein